MVLRLLIAAASGEEYADWAAKAAQSGLPLLLLEPPEKDAPLFPLAETAAPDVILVSARLLPADALSRILRRWRRITQVLVVTDGADYDFAVAAFRSGAFDLLRLPLDSLRLRQDLQDLLRTLPAPEVPSLEQRRIVGRQLISYARRVHADRQLNEGEVNSLYGTRFRAGAYRFVTICFDSLEPGFPQDPDKYLSLAQTEVLNAAGALCREMILNCDYLRYHVLLNYAPEDDPKILALLRRNLAETQESLPSGTAITFCCSRVHGSICDIIPLMDESGDAIWDRLQNQTGRLLIGAAPSPCPKDLQQIFDSAEQRLKGACATLDIDRFRRELEQLHRLPDPWKSRREMRSVLRRTEYYMFQINRELIASFTDVEQVRWELIHRLRHRNTVDSYMQVYAGHMVTLFQRILDNAVGQQSRPVRQAQQFIRQNYASELNLETVSREVGLSPVYFSAVFKKEMGIGFSDYLNQCRIEQAKKLLETTGLKVLAISKSVGFSGPRYFSRVFKELVGVRPSEYRIAMQRSGVAEE